MDAPPEAPAPEERAPVPDPAPPLDIHGADDEVIAGSTTTASSSAGGGRSRGRRRRGGVDGGLKVNTVACTGKSSKDLYTAVAGQLGWREVDTEARPSTTTGASRPSAAKTIYCVMQTADLIERLPLPASSWITRYAGCPELCDKGNWARMVMLCQDLAADGAFAFSPRTWILPDQLEELREKMGKSSKTYIVKPLEGSQGDGICLVQGARDLDIKMSCKAAGAAVVQRYLEKPLLHRGLKFDFRIYVAVIGGSNTAPPHVYLCKEGLARFCTEVYEEPTQKNMHKCMGHLTNYSLNKRSDNFEHCPLSAEEVFSTATTASKRPLTTALQQIREEHPDFDADAFYDSLIDVVRTTVALMAPVLRASGRNLHPGGELRSCQILGFDVMLDERRAPYLLEVNNSPSLCIDEALALEAEELAAAMASKPPRGRAKTTAGDVVCRCMDMAQPHRHRTSLVDLAIKKTAMVGMFELLEELGEGDDAGGGAGPAPEHPDYIEVDVAGDPLYKLLSSVEAAFAAAGGPLKAFTSAGLRKVLQPLCGQGSLEKHDLDSMAPRFRTTRFNGRDVGASTEPFQLRLFDYLDVIRQCSAKAFPGVPALAAVERALALIA